MILVTGATGTVGREVVQQLVAAGQKVRAMTRDPSKARFDSKVEVVAGDFEDPKSLDKAAAGVASVFSLPSGPKIGVHEGNLATAAKKAGVRSIVKLSVQGAGGQARSPIAAWHEAGEKAIQDSGLAWTFVRPGGFMSNARQWAATIKSMGKVFSPYGDGRSVPIHPKDIAAVSVAALTSSSHDGKAYPLTGGESLTMAEQVKTLAEAVGKPIEYVAISDEQAREGMVKAGMPPFLIDALLPMAAFIRSGKAGEVLPTVQQVLGRKPLTWAEWCQENAGAFR
jgi:uncharacterized protein YbjT (DUF2867 family)